MQLGPTPKTQTYIPGCEPAHYFCRVCNRELKNPKSAGKRIGPVCEKRLKAAAKESAIKNGTE